MSPFEWNRSLPGTGSWDSWLQISNSTEAKCAADRHWVSTQHLPTLPRCVPPHPIYSVLCTLWAMTRSISSLSYPHAPATPSQANPPCLNRLWTNRRRPLDFEQIALYKSPLGPTRDLELEQTGIWPTNTIIVLFQCHCWFCWTRIWIPPPVSHRSPRVPVRLRFWGRV